MQSKLITIVGPTASGKTSFAVRLALALGGEIIGADSRQIYRGMNIGTGKDLSEYRVNGVSIPFHLIDIRNAGDKYTLFDYQHDFHTALQEILSRNKRPILCGGTGLYIESVLKGYHLPDVPANATLRESLEGKSLEELTEILQSYRRLHNTTDTDTAKRAIRAIEIAHYQAQEQVSSTGFPSLESVVLGVHIDRELRRAKITARLKARLQEGMIDEVKSLLDSGVAADDLIYYGLEYKYVTLHVLGAIGYEEMYRQLEIAIHQFAKRQMTWFRGMERRGIPIHWIDASLPMEQKIDIALSYLSR
ncbi:MAG: tRNA (adenosine(37)-N6)-dimethylallyltransferase MiaA [Porphyromonadaceae bacterium]|nr:tRNA (adenosine(37)-N6)-dimethylallyltransferase MiaA [Porphyromonadaceae bacterium]